VHVRGMICRSLRLELVAGLGFALAIPALAWAVEAQSSTPTRTTLSTETNNAGKTVAHIAVSSQDGTPASGAVAISDNGTQIAGVALDASGEATATLSLTTGSHNLQAVYQGSTQSAASQSSVAHANTTTSTASYTVSLSPVTASVSAGDSTTVAVTVTPSSSLSLTSPLFISLSCAGLPDNSTCTFTPTTVEILPSSTSVLTSSMVLATTKASTTSQLRRSDNTLILALMLPGAFGFAGLAWCTRRRRWISRVSMVVMLGFITMMGTTGCSPLYSYYNHTPVTGTGTATGSYTITVNAQSSNGVTAEVQSATMTLTVK